MTDKCALRDEAKKHVRALLLSSPVPLTVQELERDYHNFIGEQLPYRKMGYACLEDFFRDINDAVQIHWKNGMMTLQAIADETNRHIQKLVSKQKISNTKKYAVLRKGRGRGSSAPQRFGGASHYRPPPSPKPFIPAYIRNNIKQLFLSFPQGVLLTDFDKAFSRRFGMQINYQKYGFHSMKEFLGSLLDLVCLQEENGDWLVVPADSFKKLKEPTKLASPLRNPEPEVPQKTVNEVARPSKGRGRRREKSEGSYESMDEEGARSIGSIDAADMSTQFDDDVGINHLVQEELMQLLEKSPDGIWSNNLLAFYKDTYKKDLVFKEFGYLSVIEFVSALPDIVHIERPSPQGDWKLYDARKPMPNEIKVASVKGHQSQKGVDEELKEAIQGLLSCYPTGIPVEDFPGLFQQFSGDCILPEKFGFKSMQSFLLSLDNSALQLVCREDGRLMLYSLDIDPTVTDEGEMGNCEQPSPNTAKGQIPIDAVGPGVFYTRIQPPKLNQFFEVYVSNVVSPGLFWFQLKGKNTTCALEDLMDQLDAVYSSKDAMEYKMPHEFINRGQVCVTLFPEDRNWHRGVIVNLKSDDFVEVYYVDYGNTCSVHRDSLRFMKIEFMKLPTQAIQSRLCNVQPARGRRNWCRSARDRLLNIVVNKPLIAYATNEKDGVFSILLTDTNSSVDIHINDLLVHEGYAVFSQDTSSDMAGPIVDDQLPDYTYVYGEQVQHKPRLPKANTGATTSQTTPRFIKWLQLTAHETLHIINLNDTAYVLSSEISAFFWDADILYTELIEKNMTVPKIVATKAEYPGLFEELKRFKLDVAENEDEQYTCVPLYQLDSLPNILRVFEHGSDKLIRAVEEVILNFNPKDPYWKGEVTEKGDENAKNVETKTQKEQPLANETSVEILQLSLRVLQMNRKRILQTLMEQPSPEIVNQLHNVEEHILEIQDTITAQNKKKESETQPAKSITPIKTVTASQDKASEPQQCTEGKTSPEKGETISHTNSKHTVAITAENRSTSSATISLKTNIVWPMVHQKDPNQKLFTQSVPVSLSTNISQTPTVLRGIMRPDVQAQMLQNRQLMNLQDTPSVLSADATIPQNQSVSLANATIPQNQTISSANSTIPQDKTVTSANVTMPLNQSVFANYENYMQQHTMLFQPMVLTQLGMMPGMNMGLLPSVAPLLYAGLPVPSLMGTQAPPPVTTAGMGRGQPITNDMGLLPELIPLLQNLRMNQARGRGFGGPGGPSGNL
ncbi:hypothetical protein CHS0354_036033 [Potamilus streckersoni]|uniref:Tudor domain-containing protein 5 n=1 Tax=Potamilus streckersoni TaxID=2493646 RepID=A0AAE0WD40_9BIVA|nr:hypothetical protein CHS0354_036033 [Potamilus streckersoni]